MLHGTAKASLHQMNLTARCDTWRREGRMIDLLDIENAVDCEYKYHLGNYVLSQREWKRTKCARLMRKQLKFVHWLLFFKGNTERWRGKGDYFTHHLSEVFGRKLLNKLFSFVLKSKHWIYILDVAPRRSCKRWHGANQPEKTRIHESIWDNDDGVRQWHLSHGQNSRMTFCRAVP